MNISEEVSFGNKDNIERFPWFKKPFLSLVIILVASLSFGIGRLSVVSQREGIKIEYDQSLITNTAAVVNAPVGNSAGEVVASKNGSKYHYQYCSGAKQIAEKNKIVFASPTAAEAAGYVLASNCKPR